jgi:hypothetical protein
MAILYELRQINDRAGQSVGWTVGIIAASWLVFAAAWTVTALANPLVTDNRPRRDLSLASVDPQI